MTTLQKRNKGTKGIWELQYRDENGRKRTITLSGRKYDDDTARQLKRVVKVLMDKKINDDPTQHPTTKQWLERASPEIQAKLAKVGLYNLPSKRTTQELWETFLAKQSDMLESTRETYLHARERFFRFFTGKETLGQLSQDIMKEWKESMKGKYAVATVAGTLSKAKAVFNWAKRERWITVSPLDGVGRGSYRNKTRDRFVKMETFHRLLEHCPCQEWRVIITLARMGGLHPNEILDLKWSDIDEVKHRFVVRNAKLKRLDSYEREVPLFSEVAVELETLRSLPGNGDREYVINRFPNRERCNLQTPFGRIAQKAGVDDLPRPFDNMRASRSTEIYKQFGAKVESLWIGHTVKVALESYLMVTDDDFAVAAGKKILTAIDKIAPGLSLVETEGLQSPITA